MFNLFGKRTVTDSKEIDRLLDRRLEGIFPSKEEAVKKLKEGKRLRVYLGIDPTGPDLHLGHTIQLLFLKQLLDLGHKPVLVIGDFTARIGDPTGKDTARKPLSEKEVSKNMKNYLAQVHKILPKGSFELKYNSHWLGGMSFADVLELASHMTVQQMIARDMFQERIKADKPIGIHEFLYPLMQGYDSVALKVDGEVGGNDQTFNMLVGRDLEKKLIKKDKLVFATKLLLNSEGKKMGKTEGGLIALSDSPSNMFGKTMKTVPDDMTAAVFKLCTEKPMEWIEDRAKGDPYEFKKELAFELVRMYHGNDAAGQALGDWDRVFSEGDYPTEITEIDNDELIKLVQKALNSSSTEAKRLINQGAVSVNKEVKKEWGFKPAKGDIIQIGAKTFIRIK